MDGIGVVIAISVVPIRLEITPVPPSSEMVYSWYTDPKQYTIFPFTFFSSRLP